MRQYNTRKHPKDSRLKLRWIKFWMKRADRTGARRIANWLASLPTAPYMERDFLARIAPNGYTSISARIDHSSLRVDDHVYLDDRCLILEGRDSGHVQFGKYVCIYRDTTLLTGQSGAIEVGDKSSIHPRCHLAAYVQPILIGQDVMIAANCSLFSYDHGLAADKPIKQQPLRSKGPIAIGDQAWIGTGSILLSGVQIGAGAVVAAGSVVSRDVPDGAIVGGNPARLLKSRKDISL